jgi:hypothetical protein
MKFIIKIIFTFFLLKNSLYSEDLTTKYKQIMTNTSKVSQVQSVNSPKKNNKNFNLFEEIKKIKDLKQDTFESTSDFNTRVNSAINVLENEVKFFAQNGKKEYNAGTTTMISYDADRERMKLSLKWNNDLKSIFPEIKNLKTVTLNISKHDAKALFEKQRTHYFHISISYQNKRLIVSKMILNDKYEMYKVQKPTKHKKVPAYNSTLIPTRNSFSPKSSHYLNNENITLDMFLHKFYKVGEENSVSKVLPYYAYRVDRYFSMRNVTRQDILKDKKRYYKKWVKRKYRLLNYEILDTSHTDRAILYRVKSTIYWEVTSAKGKVKHGTSTNIISLYHDHSGIVVTSIK